MANIKSAKKRAKINTKKRLINLKRKSEIKTIIKNYNSAIQTKDTEKASDLLKLAEVKISRAAGKGLYKKNTASRKISRLTKKLVDIKK